MGRVPGVLDDSTGFPYTLPSVDILDVAGSSHDTLQSFAVASGAVSKQVVMQPVRMLSPVQV